MAAIAAVNSIACRRFLPSPSSNPSVAAARESRNPRCSPSILSAPASISLKGLSGSSLPTPPRRSSTKRAPPVLRPAAAAPPAGPQAAADPEGGVVVAGNTWERTVEDDDAFAAATSGDVKSGNLVGGFAFEGGGLGDVAFGGYSSSASSSSSSSSSSPRSEGPEGGDFDRLVDRAINMTIVLAAGTATITKLLTIDHDYWHGWTIYEILRYAPLHNWTAYEEALKTNPVLAKMMISGIVYSLGDWIAQCYEGKPLFEFDRARMFRSGLVGFTLHGSLSHYYYHFCEALFPFQDWWVVPAKVVFDQTAWSAIWNSIYYVVLGFLRFESPANIVSELKATFWPMLTAGWKLWPFAHLITYGVIPVEQRLLWVDCIELIWVTILSTYSNEKSEARSSEAISETNTKHLQVIPEERVE